MSDIPLGLLFGALAFLVLLSAFFSASEAGLMTLNRYRLQYLVGQKHCGATKAQRLLQRPERLLGLILLGKHFLNIFASSLTTFIALRLWGETGIAIAVGALTFILLIITEIAPKTLATLKPEAFAFPAACLFTPLIKLCYPAIWLSNLIADTCLKMIGINPKSNASKTLVQRRSKNLDGGRKFFSAIALSPDDAQHHGF